MKILVALTYYRPHYSGLTIYAERVSRALAERGHTVTILTSRYDNKLPSLEIRDGVKVIRPDVAFHISKGVIMPLMPVWAWRLIRWADVVQLHVPQLDAAPIALLSQLFSKPVILTYHCDLQLPEGNVHKVANTASNIANHITARSADVIVHNTRDYAEQSPFLQRYLDKLQPIFPPVEVCEITQTDIDSFRDKYHIKPEDIIIGMAARLATEKGVQYLAKALPIILKSHPQARVLFVGPYKNVVGEEGYAQRLQPIVDQLGEHWSFLGIISPIEMSVFFHLSEVTVLPSINSTESFGIVQVESIYCGTPVVSTDLPGVRVPVQISNMGRVVPPKNPKMLAEAVIDLLDRVGNGQQKPEAITTLSSPDYVAEEYEKLYVRLLDRKD
ncbi:MAG: glycosyltransferase family 4 protein [Chloroflexota bacterium]|nr:glycosyltransferase family 4 protein [Chloroflexota bacterium]